MRPPENANCRRPIIWLLALALVTATPRPLLAAEPTPVRSDARPETSATVYLVNRLQARGILSAEDAANLRLLAEADAAEAKAQMALAQAAIAQANATEARARAMLAMAGMRAPDDGRAVTIAPAEPAPTEPVAPPEAPVSPAVPRSRIAPASVSVRPKSVASAAPVAAVPIEETEEPAVEAASERHASARTAAPAPASAAEGDADTVRVTYVPEVVKRRLREEVKQEVLEEARSEGWATPRSVPDWISRFRLFGDIRVRYEGLRFPAGNDNTGVFPNFNAINTGAPFDASAGSPIHSPQLNVDQDRMRARLRARAGTAIDLGHGFSGGLRLATGENNSPVTQNQSLGAAGSGQGGNFSKYSVWLDRGFLRYELGGLPDRNLAISLGRFDNPFLGTNVLWADDLGFDGLVTQGKFPLGEDIVPFFSFGLLPVFNTDLNFASNQPAKFKSNDKWLYAAQIGTTIELGRDFSLQVGAAYYRFQNVEGRLSSPFVPLNNIDAGDTDATRPAFAQKGNTYRVLRDIVPTAGDASIGGNANGTINQFQYFGLASKFQEIAVDARFDFTHFDPFRVSLFAEFVKNRGFDRTAIGAIAVNNRGASTTGNPLDGPFLGGDTAWIAGLTLGNVALKERWDWNLNLAYRRVDSDAVIDGFADSDFGGGGTNVRGLSLAGSVALSPGVTFGVRWLSGRQVAGPTLRSDTVQVDFTGKF